MIISFKSKDTERIWRREWPKKLKLPDELCVKAYDKLRILHAAATIYDFYEPPSNRFEALKGDRKGQFSIRINNRWRVCFHFEDGHASGVEIVDYH